MRSVLDHAVLQRATDGNVVEDRKMLHVFTQADTARVWADRDTEVGCHQEYRQHFIDTTHAAGIDLANANGVRLKELLENDTILHMLSGGNTNRRNGACNGGVSKYIIRAGRLFDPERVEIR